MPTPESEASPMKPRIKAAPPRIPTADSRRVLPPPKTADPVYSTPEYRAWRDAVIQRAGGQCQDLQHDTAKPRRASRLFADHIRELRDGGELLDPRNGLARCGACHTRKTLKVRSDRMRGGGSEV